jgi:hypothetical protein
VSYPSRHFLVMRLSIAMLQPIAMALSQEDAMRLIGELQDVEGRPKR